MLTNNDQHCKVDPNKKIENKIEQLIYEKTQTHNENEELQFKLKEQEEKIQLYTEADKE